MPSLQGATTRLTLSGTPGLPVTADAPASGTRTYTETYTRLGLSGTQASPYGSFTGKDVGSTLDKPATDTWLFSWVEDDINLPETSVADVWRFTWVDSSVLLNVSTPVDSWVITWSESVALNISGVTNKAGTDAWGINWSETGLVNVTATATDSWTIDWSEVGTKTIPQTIFTSVENWTLTWDDLGGVTVLTAAVPRTATDDWIVAWAETGGISVQVPVRPSRIVLTMRAAQIVMRLK